MHEQHGDLELLVGPVPASPKSWKKAPLRRSDAPVQKCEEIVRNLGNPAYIAIVLLSHARVIAWTGGPFDTRTLARKAESLINQHELGTPRARLESEMATINFLTRIHRVMGVL